MSSWSLSNGKIIEITMTEGLAIFPVTAGIIDDQAKEMVEAANCFGRPVVCIFNGVGIVANVGDAPEEIIRFWERAIEQKAAKHLCRFT